MHVNKYTTVSSKVGLTMQLINLMKSDLKARTRDMINALSGPMVRKENNEIYTYN